MNISQFVLNAVVYAKESEEAMKQMNLQPAGGGAIGFFLFDTFVLGILMVWLYSALRPRYGAGPKTAFLVGLVFAFVARLAPSINFGVLGMFPANLLVVSGLWGLVEVLLAALIGAWAYKEADQFSRAGSEVAVNL